MFTIQLGLPVSTYCIFPATGLVETGTYKVNVTPVYSLVLSWFSMEQVVDLKAEGLWEELLDGFQPEIVIQDWWVSEQPHPPPSSSPYIITDHLCLLFYHCGLIIVVGTQVDDTMCGICFTVCAFAHSYAA